MTEQFLKMNNCVRDTFFCLFISLRDLSFLLFCLHFQVHFLREHLYKVESIIQAGLGRYTWQALNIRNFAKKCQAVILFSFFLLLLDSYSNNLFGQRKKNKYVLRAFSSY